MPISAHTNFALSTLASPPSSTNGTSLTVASGHGALFPSAPFNVTVWPAGVQPTSSNAEIMRVTNKASDVFMVTRAQEGTSGRTFSANDQIAATITKRTLTDVEYGAHGWFNVKDPAYGATGDGVTNDTVALQAALTAAAVAGGVVYIPPGTYNHTTITAGTDTDIILAAGATLNHTTYNENGVVLGARSSIRGGTIESPETWDGTNSEVTYGVIYTAADNVTVEDVKLTNVPRCGILFKDCSLGIVRGTRIEGNYPSGSWSGTQTGHFGIGVDPGGGTADGLFTFTGNVIRTCVQGIFIGNYNTGSGRGIAITGNSFDGCWNHGVYAATGNGYTVTGNSFADCQIATVLTGKRHVFSGNACYTTGTGAENDVPGVSIRDAEGCVVDGNTFSGDAKASSVIISVQEFNATTCVDNIVSHNTVNVTGGSSYAIRVGAGDATTFYGNIIQGNVVRSVGFASAGVIGVVGNSGTQGFGNKILDNTITMLGNSNGIYVSQCVDTLVRGNYVRLEYSAGSAQTLYGVFLTGAATRTEIRNNTFIVPSTYGTNVTLRAIGENSSVSVADSIIANNTFKLDPTLLAGSATHFIQSGSGAFIDERGTGAPSMAALIGSRWTRTDGEFGSIFYFKESGTDSTGWVTTPAFGKKSTTGITDAAPVGVATITCSNAAHSTTIRFTVVGSLGAGGAIGANEASASASYLVTIARTAGVNMVAGISTVFGASTAAVAGAATVTCTLDLGSVSGAVGASNTVPVRATITKGSGASANHTAIISWEILNANSSGVSVA